MATTTVRARSRSNSKGTVVQFPPLRPHQRVLYAARRRFNVWVCHRRFGKTVLALYALLDGACAHPRHAPRYGYLAPLYRQAKHAAWDMLKHLAGPIPGTKLNEAELRADLWNGARVQLFGADNPDSLRGGYFDGVVLDEFAQMRPRVWPEVVRPMLADREGWAIFIGTPMGQNDFYTLYQEAQQQAEWHAALYRASETGIVSAAELTSAQHTMSPEQYAQEFECSFESALVGAYYAGVLATAETEGRVTRTPWEPQYPVHTAWDLGVHDATAIWFLQPVGRMLHAIEYLEASDQGLEWYAKALRDRPYVYGRHYFPHDMTVRDFSGTGKTRLEMATALGLTPHVLVPRGDVATGIQAVRTVFPRLVLDPDKCHEGVQALKNYRRAWLADKKSWSDAPIHDWCVTGDTKVLTRYGMYQIMDLPKTGEVLTSCGWKVYQHPRITRRNAPLVEVVFSDGLTVRCTPEHFFKTASGWISAAHLQPNSVILSSLTNSHSISTAVSTACGRVSAIWHAGVAACTAMYGRQRLVPSPMGATSITAMATSSIMPWAISNALMSTPILLRHGSARGASVSPMGILRTRRALLRLHGMLRLKDGSGTVATPSVSKTGRSGNAKNAYVAFARSLLHAFCAPMDIIRSIARPPAKPLTIAAVKKLNAYADVWCLTVPGYEEFSLANGALVHNSSHGADALRTFAMGYDDPREKAAGPPPRLPMPNLPAAQSWMV